MNYRIILLCLMCFLFYWPIIGLLPSAIGQVGNAHTGFEIALTQPVLQMAFFRSLLIATFSALLASIVAFFVEAMICMSQHESAWQRHMGKWLVALSLLPIAFPDIILGMIYAVGMNAYYWTGSMVTLTAFYLVTGIPIARLLLSNVSHRDLSAFVLAARDLGVRPSAILLRVIWPLMRSSVQVSFAILFVLYLNELVIAFFVLGPGQVTLPMVVYGSLRFGVPPYIYAAIMIISIISLIVGTLLTRFWMQSANKVSSRTEAIGATRLEGSLATQTISKG